MRDTPTLDFLKQYARTHRAKAAGEGKPMTHAQALEETARTFGFRDWNTASAAAKKQSPAVSATATAADPSPKQLYGTTVFNSAFYMQLTVAASSWEQAEQAFLGFLDSDENKKGEQEELGMALADWDGDDDEDKPHIGLFEYGWSKMVTRHRWPRPEDIKVIDDEPSPDEIERYKTVVMTDSGPGGWA